MAQIPGLDGKPVAAPSKAVTTAPKSSVPSHVPSPGGEKQTPATSHGKVAPSAKSDVMAMQGSLLEFVRAGVIPPTGLPDAKFANGAWGPKTNAAIKGVIAAAQDTLAMINELRNEGINVNVDAYNSRFLEALKTYVPELKANRANLTPEEQGEWARTIEKHLKGIKAMNEQFNVQVANKGQFRELKNKALDQYSSARQLAEVDAEESKKIDHYIQNRSLVPISIPGVANSIPVIALTSKDQYLKWVHEVYKKSPIDEKQAADLFTRVILPQLNKQQKV